MARTNSYPADIASRRDALLSAASAAVAVGFPAGPSPAASMPTTTSEQNMAGQTVTQWVLQVEHIRIETPKKIADVDAALERSVPQLTLR
jgi:hypothetical protein